MSKLSPPKKTPTKKKTLVSTTLSTLTGKIQTINIKVEDNKYLPTYETEKSACADLIARIPPQMIDGMNIGSLVKLGYRCLALVNTGIRMAIPEGFKLCVSIKDELAARGLVVVNSPIQIDHENSISVIVANVTGRDIVTIHDGDKFAKCWLEPVYKMSFNIVFEL